MKRRTNRRRPSPRPRQRPTRRQGGQAVADLGDRSTLFFFVILLTLWIIAGTFTWAYVGYAFVGAIVLSLSSWQDFFGLVILVLAVIGIFTLF
jgi:hypothetical protein